MKWTLGKIVFLAAIIAVLRVNLPAANVASGLDLAELEQADWFSRVAGGTTLKMVLSDTVAQWKYRDFLVMRFATSERLEAYAIGLPFVGWRVYESKPATTK